MFFHHWTDHRIKTNHPTNARQVDNEAMNHKRIISPYPNTQSVHKEPAYVAISRLYKSNQIPIPLESNSTISFRFSFFVICELETV